MRRSALIGAHSPSLPVVPPPIRHHTQFVSGCFGYQVGVKLLRIARARMLKRESEQEQNLEVMAEAAGIMESVHDPLVHDYPYCNFCGRRRKLCFISGVRSRVPCPCLCAKRRRLSHTQTDVHGIFDPSLRPFDCSDTVDQRDADGHLLFVVSELTFCWRSGSYSTERVHRLSVSCRGTPGDGQGYRLRRLKRGRHPISNLELDGAVRRLQISSSASHQCMVIGRGSFAWHLWIRLAVHLLRTFITT